MSNDGPGVLGVIGSQLSAIGAAAGQTIENAATAGALFKEVALAGGKSAFKFFNIFSNFIEIKNAWFDPVEKTKHSLPAKIGLTALYLGNVAITSIAAAALLGATVLAAPFVTAITCGISLVINTAEFFKELFYIRALEKEVLEIEKKWIQDKISFANNSALYAEIELHIASQRKLQAQRELLQAEIQAIDDIEKVEEEKAALEKIVAAKEKLLVDNIVKDKMILEAPASLDTLLDVKKQLEDLPSAENQEKLNVVNLVIEHHKSILTLEIALEEIRTQKEDIDSKYATDEMKREDPSKVEALKAAEIEYLDKRMISLNEAILAKKDPALRLQQITAQQLERSVLAVSASDKTTLREKLTQDLKKIEGSILEENKAIKRKSNIFGWLFSTDPNNLDRKAALKKQGAQILNDAVKHIDLNQKILVEKNKRNQRFRNILISGTVFAFAVAICIPPAWPFAGILGGVMIGVGGLGVVNLVYTKLKERYLQKNLKLEKEQKVSSVLKSLDTAMKEVFNKELEQVEVVKPATPAIPKKPALPPKPKKRAKAVVLSKSPTEIETPIPAVAPEVVGRSKEELATAFKTDLEKAAEKKNAPKDYLPKFQVNHPEGASVLWNMDLKLMALNEYFSIGLPLVDFLGKQGATEGREALDLATQYIALCKEEMASMKETFKDNEEVVGKIDAILKRDIPHLQKNMKEAEESIKEKPKSGIKKNE